MPEFTFLQAKNKGNRTWHSGIWKKKLEIISHGSRRQVIGSVATTTRVNYILSQRVLFSKGVAGFQVGNPQKGIPFFKFEENLSHEVNEAYMMISTGISCSFFENPHVRKTFHDLQPRHRPVHRKKLIRLVRCVIDESGEEVSYPNDQQ